MCIGRYGDVAMMPEFPEKKGPEIFEGKVLHTIDYCKLDKDATSDLIKDKKDQKGNHFPLEKPNQSILRLLLSSLFSPLLRKVASKLIESYLLRKLPLEKYGLKPEHPFVEDYASCQMAVIPEKFIPEADKGNIVFKKASNWWFWEKGIEFEDKSKIEADVVILATGYDGNKSLKLSCQSHSAA
ncbi:hypothetical protein F8388_002393 [Cannabis sativa]|uniref:Flavin-containing monooxygenase n=1 Tax=Cannabis sativa TaxID=3483 RepID=A0A7J6EGD2_CANSA|nr:hypothetical protein F8388_002393 [Cannabis sativa]